jgi:hypothetical protein
MYQPNKSIDLEPLIAQNIPPVLSYACQFWGEHLHGYDANVVIEVWTFLKHKFLYWLEVLSLINGYHHASTALTHLKDWTKVCICIVVLLLRLTKPKTKRT